MDGTVIPLSSVRRRTRPGARVRGAGPGRMNPRLQRPKVAARLAGGLPRGRRGWVERVGSFQWVAANANVASGRGRAHIQGETLVSILSTRVAPV